MGFSGSSGADPDNVTLEKNVSNLLQIKALGVNTAQIAANAITLAKMALGTAGNLITYDASGNPAAVATGTAGQVLTSNGAGAAPTMQAPTGGLTLVQSQTVSAVTSISFTGLTGARYLLVFNGLNNTTNAVWAIRYNNISTATYDWLGSGNTGTTHEVTVGGAAAQIRIADFSGGAGGSDTSRTMFWFISSIGGTAGALRFNLMGMGSSRSDNNNHSFWGSERTNVTSITQLDIIRESGTGTLTGTATLYKLG